MSYVIYNKETTILAPLNTKSFSTETAAKAALTRAVNEGRVHDRDAWAISEKVQFEDHIEKWVTKTNLMSGKPVEMPINTPLALDPSSETYWSM